MKPKILLIFHLYICTNFLAAGHLPTQLVNINVDWFKDCGETIFYKKNSKFYSYSTLTNKSYFINWNVDNFSIGPDKTMLYSKGSKFYLLPYPYSNIGKHITWNIDKHFWLPNGTLFFLKDDKLYFVIDNVTGRHSHVEFNVKALFSSCSSQVAYLKKDSLYYLSYQNRLGKVFIDFNASKPFFLDDYLYYKKRDDLWLFNPHTKKKKLLVRNVSSLERCQNRMLVKNRNGLYIIQNGSVFYTGHRHVTNLSYSYRGITYTMDGRLYFTSGLNPVNLCDAPTWSTFSDNGCIYLLHKNHLCYIDEDYGIVPIVKHISRPAYKNGHVYYYQNSQKYYLNTVKGEILKCK